MKNCTKLDYDEKFYEEMRQNFARMSVPKDVGQIVMVSVADGEPLTP